MIMGKKNPKFIADKNMRYKVARIIIKAERKQKKKGRSKVSSSALPPNTPIIQANLKFFLVPKWIKNK